MSYCSENKLSLSTPVSRLIEVIELLGYKRIQTGYKRVSTALKTENEIPNNDFYRIQKEVGRTTNHIVAPARNSTAGIPAVLSFHFRFYVLEQIIIEEINNCDPQAVAQLLQR